ncbi:Disease resistance protein RPS6 [Cardamine amara subsp. amara]|uniref:Disease resistance protein RPS6 n=1 Tax=Cardamine amara subsp. amara TaxID=228776 RepID=A0ABD1ATN3_CARAN
MIVLFTRKNEAKIIEDIANNVLDKLLLTTSKDFEDFVGIEDHIAKISLLLHMECEKVRMVGIWGSSGIGKTTIARALFSRLKRHFQSSVFIDRSFISKSKELYSKSHPDDYNMKLNLQRNFLSEILDKKDMKIDHLGALGERLRYHKVLILIDDLDDLVVLDALAGQTQWFGCGSRIIVVTKDKHILRAHGINNIYEVQLPSKNLALEMLCRSAFKKNSPPHGFMELASKVVECVDSLPLGLNVLGTYLREINEEDWMDMLLRHQNGIDEGIQKTLQLSYDGLNNKKDKALFRHIACLFNYVGIIDIKQLLADSELDVNMGLKILNDKSLIHISRGSVQMHHLLQEMGKEIVRAQSS